MIDNINEYFTLENRQQNGAITAEEYAALKSLNIDIDFIEKREGFETEGYIPTREGRNDGTIFGNSGVTIGFGIDLGQRSLMDFVGFEDQELIKKLEPYFGLKKQDAQNLLLENIRAGNPLVVTEDEANRLSNHILENLTGTLRTNFTNLFGVDLADVPPQLQTVVASIGTQYGPNFLDNPTTEEYDPKTPKFAEKLREVVQSPEVVRVTPQGSMMSPNIEAYETLIDELRNFGDAYDDRREAEADLIQSYIEGIGRL